MPSQQTWERALERYADSLYRVLSAQDAEPASDGPEYAGYTGMM